MNDDKIDGDIVVGVKNNTDETKIDGNLLLSVEEIEEDKGDAPYIPPPPYTGPPYVQSPLLRGIFEINPILDLCDRFGGWVIGGYARYCASINKTPVPSQDVDIFTLTQEVLDKWKEYLIFKGIAIVHENDVSISYQVQESGEFQSCPQIQLIKPVNSGSIITSNSVEDVLNNFDFSVVRVCINRDRRTATAWHSFQEDENHRLLKLLNIHCPISSLLRCMKYGRKGFYIRPTECLKLFRDWEDRDEKYKMDMIELFRKGEMAEITQQEIDELEKLLRID